MPFDGTGNYAPPAPPTFPAINGEVVRSDYFNAIINDIATALSLTFTKDGQSVPTATLEFNNQDLINIAAIDADSIDVSNFYQNGNLLEFTAFSRNFLAAADAEKGRILLELGGITQEVSNYTFDRGIVAKRLDIILNASELVQPELHWTGINSSWLSGIDVVWNTRKGTNFVPAALVDTVNDTVADLWMLQFRGYVYATLTAASVASTIVTLDDTTNIEVGMQISTAAMRAGGLPTVWPKVVSVDSAVQVTLDTAVTLADATAVRFGDNPTFGFGFTPPNKYTYRSQFGTPDNETTMGTVGIRVAAAQTGYALGIFDSTNTHMWGVNAAGYLDGIKVRDTSAPGSMLQFYKNDYSAVYEFKYNGNSLTLRYASGRVDFMQFDTDGTITFSNPVTFTEGLLTKPDGSDVFQTIQKADASLQYSWKFSGNTFLLRNDTGGVTPISIETDGSVDFVGPVRVGGDEVLTTASAPAPASGWQAAGMKRQWFGMGSTYGVVGWLDAGTGSGFTSTVSNTNRRTRMLRRGGTSAAANTGYGWRWDGGSSAFPRDSGFVYECVFSWAEAASSTIGEKRMLVGMREADNFQANVDPSTLVDFVGMAADTGDANWQIMYNDGSGTATKVDTGFAKALDDVFYVRVTGSSSGVSVYIERYASTNLTMTPTATFGGTVYTTNIPAGTTSLAPVCYGANGATAATGTFEVMTQSLLSPF